MDTRNTVSGEVRGDLVQAGVVHGDVVQVVNVGESHGQNDVGVGLGWRYMHRDPDPDAAPWDFFWKEWADPEIYKVSIRNKLACPLGISDAGFVLRYAQHKLGKDIVRISVPGVQFPLRLNGDDRLAWSTSSADLSGLAAFQKNQEYKHFLLVAYAVTLHGREFNAFNLYPGNARVGGTRLERQYLNRKAQGASPSGEV